MSELGTGPTGLFSFATDFWRDSIFLSRKAYPLGYFSVGILNWDGKLTDDLLEQSDLIMTTLLAISQSGMCRELFGLAKEFVMALQELLFIREPFSLLDVETEKRRVVEIFKDEMFERIISNTEVGRDFFNYLNWYSYIPNDVINFRHTIIRFEESYLSRAKPREESGYAKASRGFLSDSALLLAIEESKPIPDVEGFTLMPIVRSQTAVLEHPHEPDRLTFVDRLYFNSLMDFLVTDFFRGLRVGHAPKRCPICGRYFLTTDKRHQKYCDYKTMPGHPKGYNCRKEAAARGRAEKEKAPDHPIKSLCVKRLGTIAKHKKKGKISAAFAEAAKNIARNRRDRALHDYDYYAGSYAADMTQEAIYEAAQMVIDK